MPAPQWWRDLNDNPDLMAALGAQIYAGSLTNDPFSGLFASMGQLPGLLGQRRQEEEERRRREEEAERKKRLDELLIASREMALERARGEPEREEAAKRQEEAAEATRRAAALGELARLDGALARNLRHAPVEMLERRVEEIRRQRAIQGEIGARQDAAIEMENVKAQVRGADAMRELEVEARAAEAQRSAFQATTGIGISGEAWAAMTNSERSDLLAGAIKQQVTAAQPVPPASEKETMNQLRVYHGALTASLKAIEKRMEEAIGDDAMRLQGEAAVVREKIRAVEERMGEVAMPKGTIEEQLRRVGHPSPELLVKDMEKRGIMARVQILVSQGVPVMKAIRQASAEAGIEF